MDKSTITDEEMIQDYPRLKLEYTRLHEDYRRLSQQREKVKDFLECLVVDVSWVEIRNISKHNLEETDKQLIAIRVTIEQYLNLTKEPNTNKEDIECLQCKGHGEASVQHDAKPFQCDLCKGTGIQPQEEDRELRELPDLALKPPNKKSDFELAIEQSIEESTPRSNGKPCKNGCNCLEIAEYNNGQGVMNYECLGKEQEVLGRCPLCNTRYCEHQPLTV